MKKLLASGICLFLALSATLSAIDSVESNSIKEYILDQIDLLDDDIAAREKTTTHFDSMTIYQMGYQFGKRRAYYEMLDYVK